MNGIVNFEGLPRFINGQLIKNAEGELLLNTRSGSIPVSLEGASIPLGEEIIFEFLRAEPGKLILTPLSKWETVEETLPFLRSIPLAERGEWERLIRAAVQEELPLDKNVLLNLRKWSLTAEKSWGVKVEPRVFAFLLSKGLPVNQATVLWALYTRYPSVQREMWRQLSTRLNTDARAEANFSSGSRQHMGSGYAQTGNQGQVGENATNAQSREILNLILQMTKTLGKVGANGSPVSKTDTSELNNQQMTAASTTNAQQTGVAGKNSVEMNQDLQNILFMSQGKSGGQHRETTGIEKNTQQGEQMISAGGGKNNQPQTTEGRFFSKPNSIPVGFYNKEPIDSELDQGNKLRESIQREERTNVKNVDTGELWTEILRGSSRFLANQSREDNTLAQLIFCLFPHHDKEVRWEVRGQRGEEDEDGYSFRLSYDSHELKQVEVIGANSRDGLELLIGVQDVSGLQPHFAELKSFLTSRGWKVKRVRVMEITAGKSEEHIIPRRIDGWV